MCDLNEMWTQIYMCVRQYATSAIEAGDPTCCLSQTTGAIRSAVEANFRDPGRLHMCMDYSHSLLADVVIRIAVCPRPSHLALVQAILDPFERAGGFGSDPYYDCLRYMFNGERMTNICPVIFGLFTAFDDARWRDYPMPPSETSKTGDHDGPDGGLAVLSGGALDFIACYLVRVASRGRIGYPSIASIAGENPARRDQVAAFYCCLAAVSNSTKAVSTRTEAELTRRARRMYGYFLPVKALLESGWLARAEAPRMLVDDVWSWVWRRLVGGVSPPVRLVASFGPTRVIDYLMGLPDSGQIRAALAHLTPDAEELIAADSGELVHQFDVRGKIWCMPAFYEFGFAAQPYVGLPIIGDSDAVYHRRLAVTHTLGRLEHLKALSRYPPISEWRQARMTAGNAFDEMIVRGKLLCEDYCERGFEGDCQHQCACADQYERYALRSDVEEWVCTRARDAATCPALQAFAGQPPPLDPQIARTLVRLFETLPLPLAVSNWLHGLNVAGIQFLDLPVENV